MHWQMMVLKRAAFSRLPFNNALRNLRRRWFGYPPDVHNLRGTLANLDQMKAALAVAGRSFEGATILELGSGWFPTIPIMLSLGGARRIYTSDLVPHMDEVTFGATLAFLKTAFPADGRLQAMNRLADLPVAYLAPFDADQIPDGSVDFVISRTVLEHIPEPDLNRLLASLRQKLAPGGLMVHLVDHSDHLEHSDKSISRINFLTWSSRKHAFINWLMCEGENRLRHHQYAPLFVAAGFDVLYETAEVHEPTRQIAAQLPLVEPYASMSAGQLSIMTSIFVLAPKPAS